MSCIWDYSHQTLAPANSYFASHPEIMQNTKTIYLIVIDLLWIVTLTHWSIFSCKWKLLLDLTFFGLARLFCTHVISYRIPEGAIWPDTPFWSLSNVPLTEVQYQVSALCGGIYILGVYWLEHKGVTFWVGVGVMAFCAISACLEMIWRISYCTGRYKINIDIFAAILIGHLASMLNSKWAEKVDITFNHFLAKLTPLSSAAHD